MNITNTIHYQIKINKTKNNLNLKQKNELN